MFDIFRRQHYEDTQEVSSSTLARRRAEEIREHCITGQVFERVEPTKRVHGVEVQSQEAKEEEQSGGGDGA